MRTSKSQQEKTRRQILRCAVELMTAQGFEGTTMKQIARAAELGDATIYKYFPSKEKLVLAYFEQAAVDALVLMQKTKGQQSFALQERLQLLVDSLLELLLADREFVAIAHQMVQGAPMLLIGQNMPGKEPLRQAFIEMLTQAEAAGEIAPCAFKPSLGGLLADYVYGIAAYWLKDDSEQFGNTTQLVDLSLGVLVLALQSGIVNKLLDLGGFMLRSQLSRLLQNQGGGLMELLSLAKRGLSQGGRP
ncbi:TetR/AcrR family transcriptional regulator [Paucibacter sp. Y2R2-4]|uniref:TetR/AcrR family transcriptional regulator n=1 Tax=Paucibacter sp. Y2R2-4 TaxID=2893553 RepID=UPI0021E3E25F|nr:TetR/AcrR family transcriptional regulator [Paucibacter sp. Y2R2-4]MCV2351686.1 TetR/AcrR family transcriptional regulator [Paucibacter sp. Y2R2-4]